MSQEQYNTLLSNLLREKCALAKLRVELERGNSVEATKGLGTWPKIAGIEKRKKREQRCLKINLKF